MMTDKRLSRLALALLVAWGAAALADDVAENWRAKCKSCHGELGKGDTKAGQKLRVPDFSLSAWQGKHADEAIRTAIVDGVPDTKMKAFKDKLSTEEIDGLVGMIRGFAVSGSAAPVAVAVPVAAAPSAPSTPAPESPAPRPAPIEPPARVEPPARAAEPAPAPPLDTPPPRAVPVAPPVRPSSALPPRASVTEDAGEGGAPADPARASDEGPSASGSALWIALAVLAVAGVALVVALRRRK